MIVTVKSIRTGDGTIYGRVTLISSTNTNDEGSEQDILYIQIGEDEAKVDRTQALDIFGGYPVFNGNNPNQLLMVIPYDQKPFTPEKTIMMYDSGTTKTSSSESLNFVHPLEISGYFSCYISQNLRKDSVDEEQPIVWGGVYIYDSQYNFLDSGSTGSGSGKPAGQNAEEFSITVENPYPLGFIICVAPYSNACVVGSDGTGYNYEIAYQYSPVDFSHSSFQCPSANPAEASYNCRGAWRIYESLVNDVHNRGAWNFLVYSWRGPYWTPTQASAWYPVNLSWPFNPPYYDSITGSNAIYLDKDSQTRGLNTVQHEYAHFIMHDLIYDFSLSSPLLPAYHYL